MRITRRDFSALGAAGLAAAALPRPLRADAAATRSHGASLLGSLKYGPDFNHFDYVNPDAPKGGLARLVTQQSFDSFNPFIVKGNPPTGVSMIFDRLMTGSLDEGSTEYGLLAEWIEIPNDQSWVAFKVREHARWHDGRPVTAEDVVFSLNILREKGDPFYRQYYHNVVDAQDMGENVARFQFDQGGNRELPQIMGQLSILPKHWWEGRAFDESGLDPLLGSGPYRIGDFELGRFIEYVRVEDYWGADLPVNVGQNNFDKLRFEIFLDETATLEGFKSGDFDYRNENSAKNWSTAYNFPAVKSGLVKTAEVHTEGPKQVQTFAFNLRREKFRNRKLREAITLAFDFERTNKAIYFGQYARPQSYFQGTKSLMPDGPPTGQELAMLEEFRGQVPEEVFEAAWTPPVSDNSGRNRRNLRRAQNLLQEAGYEVRDKVLHGPDGQPFEIEFLSSSSAQERVINPFIDNLETLGFKASLRIVDRVQYVRTIAQDPTFDWDMIIYGVANSESPGNEQRDLWGSSSSEVVGARNIGGVADPVVDALIEKIIFAADRPELEAASKALDRVLTWNWYMVPQLYTPFERIAWWDRFGHPDPFPARTPGFPDVWWWEEEKAKAVEKAL